MVLPAHLVAIVVIMAIYKLCGINRIDGLADFGDGVIAHGPVENKIKAMKDVNTGTGGVVFMVMLLAAYACLADMPARLLPLALVAAEVSAKQSMIGFAAFSRSLQKGLGYHDREAEGMKVDWVAISAVICVAALDRWAWPCWPLLRPPPPGMGGREVFGATETASVPAMRWRASWRRPRP